MYSPQISIVIPVHNAGQYLEEALMSVSQQTFLNYECIIVNGGSTDNSLQIIEEFVNKDSRFTVYNISNLGSGSVHRKFGINKTNTDIIFTLDADDLISKDCLELMFQKFKGLKVEIVLQKTIAFSNDNIDDVIWYLPHNDIITGNIMTGLECCLLTIGGWKLSTAGMMFKKSLYGFDVDNLMNADEMISRNLLINASNVAFSNSIYYYRNNSSSFSRALTPRVFERLLVDIQLDEFIIMNYGESNPIYYVALKTRINNLINMYFEFYQNKEKFKKDEIQRINEIIIQAHSSIKFKSKLKLKDYLQELFLLKSYKLFKVFSYIIAYSSKIRGKKYIYK